MIEHMIYCFFNYCHCHCHCHLSIQQLNHPSLNTCPDWLFVTDCLLTSDVTSFLNLCECLFCFFCTEDGITRNVCTFVNKARHIVRSLKTHFIWASLFKSFLSASSRLSDFALPHMPEMETDCKSATTLPSRPLHMCNILREKNRQMIERRKDCGWKIETCTK